MCKAPRDVWDNDNQFRYSRYKGNYHLIVPPIYLIRGASRTPTGPPALVMAPSSL